MVDWYSCHMKHGKHGKVSCKAPFFLDATDDRRLSFFFEFVEVTGVRSFPLDHFS